MRPIRLRREMSFPHRLKHGGVSVGALVGLALIGALVVGGGGTGVGALVGQPTSSLPSVH